MSRPGNKIFEGLNLVMALMFLTGAVLQYNDPDPFRWIAVYGAATVACLLAPRMQRAGVILPAVVGLFCLVWVVAIAPRVLPELELGNLVRTMEVKTPAIEESRELLGLLLITAWMAVLGLASRKDGSARSR